MEIAALYKIFEQHPHVSTDSRKIAPGSMFFALHGDNFDGNRFAATALDQGAVVAVVDDPSVVESAAKPDRYVLVDDTLKALQQLAAYHRKVLNIPVLAITGSNGKTTTKELVARVLACKFNTSVTQGNLNNHIGVPLTLLSIDSSCEFAVVEMGASACGEIAMLCEIAAPDYGLITNVGRAHLEGFGSQQGVRIGKGELFDYLRAHNGTAFYLADDQVLSEMIGERTGIATVGYSANIDGIKSRLVGDYNRYNIAAAAAIGSYFGVSQVMIAEAVWSYEPDNNRSQRVVTACNELIVDCYNANPSSMGAALKNFASESVSKDGVEYEKWAILGDMLELGQYSVDEHLGVLRELNEVGVSDVFVVGANFVKACEGFSTTAYRLHTYADRVALQDYLVQNPPRGKFILIKGSRGIGLEKCLPILPVLTSTRY